MPIKPRFVDVVNNTTCDDDGQPFGIKLTGILYGDFHFVYPSLDGLSVVKLKPNSYEIVDDTPHILQITLPHVHDPIEDIDITKLINMSTFELFDYLSSLEDRRYFGE